MDDEFRNYLREVSRRNNLSMTFLTQVLALGYAANAGKIPEIEELRKLYEERFGAGEADWDSATTKAQNFLSSELSVDYLTNSFVKPFLEGYFPEIFTKPFDWRQFSFVVREYINNSPDVDKHREIPISKSRDHYDYEFREVDYEAWSYLIEVFVRDDSEFDELVRDIVYFEESGHMTSRAGNSVRTVGSFWDHFEHHGFSW